MHERFINFQNLVVMGVDKILDLYIDYIKSRFV